MNGDYYAEHGYHPIIAGVAPGCFLSDNWSAVNMGPYYSNQGAAQAVVNFGATNKLVVVSPDQPGMDFNNSSVAGHRQPERHGVRGHPRSPSRSPTRPVSPSALVQAAGEGGGVVLNFTGPTVLPLLEAISQQGLVDSVIWGSSTPPNDPSVAAALADCCGTDWNDKFLINAEFNLLDSGEPDNNKMLEIHEAASADFPISAFSQMGYLVGKFTTEALLRMGEGAEYTVETVNAAIYALTDAESDMLCKPWYYTSGTGRATSRTTPTARCHRATEPWSRSRSASRSCPLTTTRCRRSATQKRRWPPADADATERSSERGPAGFAGRPTCVLGCHRRLVVKP